jgi:3-isopropylmalate/(R)-2-methylmalate dehydratase small subunit
MEPFVKLRGIVGRVDRINVDTDQIIPKQFLKLIGRTGFGKFLFYDWRYINGKELNPEFELNKAEFQGAQILIAGKNFGCGSSREHAPWALLDYGFRVIIAPSFADIFYNNCFKNGILPVVLPEEVVQSLMIKAGKGYQLEVDLEEQKITDSDGFEAKFEVDAFRRHCLLNGLDDISLTMQHEDAISAYEASHPSSA